jgi:hypothetical protein
LAALRAIPFFFSQRRKAAKKYWSTYRRQADGKEKIPLLCAFPALLVRRGGWAQRNTSLPLLTKDAAGNKEMKYR